MNDTLVESLVTMEVERPRPYHNALIEASKKLSNLDDVALESFGDLYMFIYHHQRLKVGY